MAATKDDITEEELKMVGGIRHLRIKPEGIELPQHFEKFVKTYDRETVMDKRNLPRLSICFGEEGKGEDGHQTWKYEIECLVQDTKYAEDQILMAGYMEIN